MRNLFGNKKGTTLAELLLASMILAVAAGAGYSSLNNFNTVKLRVVGSQARTDITSSLIENIKANISKYQANFNYTQSRSEEDDTLISNSVLAKDNLPFAWSTHFVGGVDECPTCAGRFGFIIQPVAEQKYLYQVQIRVINEDLFPGHRDFYFITGVK